MIIRAAAAVLLPLTSVVLASPAMAQKDEILRIGRADIQSELTDMAAAVLRVAYSRTYVAVEFVPFPLRRSLMLADKGETDGELMRIASAAELAPNLIRIDVPISRAEVAAYARAPCPVVRTWDDLKPYRVTYPRGVLVIEKRVGQLTKVEGRDPAELFRMLDRGLTDIVLEVVPDADVAFRKLGSRSLCRIPGVLESEPLFHYLHKRHANTALQLTAVLRAMQQSGEIDAILEAEIRKLTP